MSAIHMKTETRNPMRRDRTGTIIAIAVCALALAVGGCSRDEAKKAAEDAAGQVKEAGQAAEKMAGDVADKTGAVAANMAEDAVAACQRLAKQNAWDEALEVCEKAHEMLPDDLALEHAYQQAKAAAAE